MAEAGREAVQEAFEGKMRVLEIVDGRVQLVDASGDAQVAVHAAKPEEAAIDTSLPWSGISNGGWWPMLRSSRLGWTSCFVK